jgi:hypothetical protein
MGNAAALKASVLAPPILDSTQAHRTAHVGLQRPAQSMYDNRVYPPVTRFVNIAPSDGGSGKASRGLSIRYVPRCGLLLYSYCPWPVRLPFADTQAEGHRDRSDDRHRHAIKGGWQVTRSRWSFWVSLISS